MTTIICLYCQETFERNKYSPRQKVCSKDECQHQRQISSMRDWRQKHPNYFRYDESKGEDWLRTQRERSRVWRKRNPDKIKAYRETHIEEYRKYMREYMKQYRDRKKVEKKPDVETSQPAPVQQINAEQSQPVISDTSVT